MLEGGTQPPSIEDIKNIYGEEFYKEVKEKQIKSLKETYNKKRLKYLDEIKEMLDKGELMKDIAKKIKVNRNTISEWIKRYNLTYDDSKKRKLQIELLNSFRDENSKKVQKTAKLYTIVTPLGEEITTNKLVNFCKEKNIDYRGLRNTYNAFKSNGEKRKYKGYYIIQQVDNQQLTNFCN